MKLDPKYFNTFLAICFVIAAGLIVFFTLSNRSSEHKAFQERMFEQDSLRIVTWNKVQTDDSLRISDFKGKFVVVDFWGNWSKASLRSHRQLAKVKQQYSDSIAVIAAAVGLQKDEAINYIQENQFPFNFVAGSKQFSEFQIPGLPAQLVYNPKGQLESIFMGYSDKGQYDSLKTIISDGR
ncbi:Thiol-disulfide isomerase or thioredoxin [Fodinibius salinus]|uniref:Thiol-disulfide isomerase or thioredoxin n=1 Tax=Fodinibius salinus TaxID=860790 RepID=A0A5D3YQM1_9BACT|nr:TlpA disulfide reductase family protein [Fodinibius salinus]TYP95283.1 Thiol-disulfide isomerase or thioredoxin [Fodinibius salinus]